MIVPSFLAVACLLSLSTYLHSLASAGSVFISPVGLSTQAYDTMTLTSLAMSVTVFTSSFVSGLIAFIPENFGCNWGYIIYMLVESGMAFSSIQLARLVYHSVTVSSILADSTASLRFAPDCLNSFYREINQTRQIIQSWSIEVRGYV